jgi:hypothetical protein
LVVSQKNSSPNFNELVPIDAAEVGFEVVLNNISLQLSVGYSHLGRPVVRSNVKTQLSDVGLASADNVLVLDPYSIFPFPIEDNPVPP